MGTFHYYILDKREDMEFSGEITTIYLIHRFRDEDFSNVVHGKKVPAHKVPTEYEVGDLIETEEEVWSTKLKQVPTTHASPELQERVQEVYADQKQKLAEYADHLGVDTDYFSDTLRKPGKSVPRNYYYINRREGDQYVIDTLGDTTLESWSKRTKIPAEPISDRFNVGDVLVAPKNSPSSFDEAEVLEPARSQAATAIRDDFAKLDTGIREYVAEHDTDLDEPLQSIEDGDVILVAVREKSWRQESADEYVYVTPEGLYSNDRYGNIEISFDMLINCSRSILESGMTFEVIKLDNDYVDAIRYDRDRTQETRDDHALVNLHWFNPERMEIDSRDDLERPLYVLFDGYDDGAYYTDLYDSGGDEDSGWPGLRMLVGGQAWSAEQVLMDWPYPHGGGPVPVSKLILDEEDHPEAPVAFVSHESEPAYTRTDMILPSEQ